VGDEGKDARPSFNPGREVGDIQQRCPCSQAEPTFDKREGKLDLMDASQVLPILREWWKGVGRESKVE
jgi:hypothetical protein